MCSYQSQVYTSDLHAAASGHAQFEFTDDRFYRGGVYNATYYKSTGKQSKYTKYSGKNKRKIKF